MNDEELGKFLEERLAEIKASNFGRKQSAQHRRKLSLSIRKARGLNLPAEEIVRMYIEDKLGMQTIADYFHVDITTIWNRLDKAGVVRSQSEAAKVKMQEGRAPNFEPFFPNKGGKLAPMYGKAQSQKQKEATSNALKELWKDPEWARMTVSKMCKQPNQIESFLQGILDATFPGDWDFVGDGQLVMETKCPDFADTLGNYWLIELYGDYWHEGENSQERIDFFASFGFDTVVIWESELREPELVLEKIHNAFYKEECYEET